jgi:hypothetical protein
MNHLGDTNKMVSDTPRMDASAYDDGAIWETGCDIERELNAANERISKLYDYVAALETGGDLMAHELGFGYDVDLWNKARGEAKP